MENNQLFPVDKKRKKPILNPRMLTWGFEIEGLFKNSLWSDLCKYAGQKQYDFEKKYDGSVKWDRIREHNYGKILKDEGDAADIHDIVLSEYEELNLGVFRSLAEMFRVLEMFKFDDNYFCDESCGLHIHIGTMQRIELGSLVHRDLIEKWQNFIGVNATLKDRMTNYYCHKYNEVGSDGFRNSWLRRDKYRSIKNHEDGTLEMRVFSPFLLKDKKGIEFIYKAIKLLVMMISQPVVCLTEEEVETERQRRFNHKKFDLRLLSVGTDIVENYSKEYKPLRLSKTFGKDNFVDKTRDQYSIPF